MTETVQAETKQTTALQTVAQFEQAFPDGKFNRLLPSIILVETVQKFSKLTIELVKIDPNPRNQEVFSLGKFEDDNGWHEKLAFTKTALDKIAYTMGLHWISEECGRVDDRSNRDYFEYFVAAYVTKSDGTRQKLTATKSIHVQNAVDETENKMRDLLADGKLYRGFGQNRKKLTPGPEADTYIARKMRAREIHVRTHGLALAESGARNRLIRGMNIKGWYTAEELALPFVVPRIDINVEEVHADPKQRAITLGQAAKSVSKIFGTEQPTDDQVNAMEKDKTLDADFETVVPEDTTPQISKRDVFIDNIKSMDSSQKHGQMLSMIDEQDIKKRDTDQPMQISFKAWDGHSNEEQTKYLLWAFDLKPTEEEPVNDLPNLS